MTGKDLFYTRGPANEGALCTLWDPRTNKKTDAWIRVRGRDSDVARQAWDEEKRKLLDIIQIEDEDLKKNALNEQVLRIRASLVMAWSFSENPTAEEIVDFLRESPQIADQIDEVASERANFLARSSGSSPDTSSTSSSSKSPQPEEESPSGST